MLLLDTYENQIRNLLSPAREHAVADVNSTCNLYFFITEKKMKIP